MSAMNEFFIQKKVLVFGAGVIGSIYALKLSNAGHDVTLYARGKRLQSLKSKGLLYNEKKEVKKARVKIADTINAAERFDYVFVAVRYEQIDEALQELKQNDSPNIVTMVNNPKGYAEWEEVIGKGKLIPAFAGAGGTIEDDILHYVFTPRIIQSTTFGEVGGTITGRLEALAKVFKSCRIPYSISKNMDAWQKSHLALVVPLANGVYFAGGNTYALAKNKEALRTMGIALKKNFAALKSKKTPITPPKLNAIRICPLWAMIILLKLFCRTKLAETLTGHVPYARNEMEVLNKELHALIKQS